LTAVPIKYTAGSLEEARALPPDAAKAILVALSAGVANHSPGETRRGALPKLTFEVMRVEDGWFVYCYGGGAGSGSSVHIDLSWAPGKLYFGAPPGHPKYDPLYYKTNDPR
jgi:hypothetical protein